MDMHDRRGKKEQPEAAPDDKGLNDPELFEAKVGPEAETIAGYIAEFGIDISELNPRQLAMFIAARNLEDKIKDLKIPAAKVRTASGEMILVEHEVERVIEKTTYRDGEESTPTPDNSMDITPIETTEELPRVLPTEWMLEEEMPDEFYRRLADKTLLRPDWRRPVRTPVKSYETIKEIEVHEEPAPPQYEKQHAYVLLDTSGSMNNDDGRAIIACGLTLAFLRQGHKQNARLAIRTFTDSPHDLSAGRGEEALEEIARRIISSRPWGGTDIRMAIVDAVRDIQGGGEYSRADILLITDGLSYLDGNPLGDIKLHTFIIGDVFDGLSIESRKSVESALRTLKRWSKTFKHIKASENSELLKLNKEDLDPLYENSRAIPDYLKGITSIEEFYKVINSLKLLSQMAESLDSDSVQSEKKLAQLKALLKQLSSDLEDIDPVELIQSNNERIEAEIARRRAEKAEKAASALEELAEKFGGPSSSNNSASNSNHPQNEQSEKKELSIWQVIKRAASRLIGRTKPAY
ncbi:MAG: VWA domain-containing protein [Candidatus Dadabacteria bacterium]|nr:MAG: VWA domain-containing protein [Candidatus Dadabacteria bacterium]